MNDKSSDVERPIEDLVAGNAFRDGLRDRADSGRGAAPLWHGWALMDAFLAGTDYARAAMRQAASRSGKKREEHQS